MNKKNSEDSIDMELFRERLIKRLDELNLTQKQLADIIGSHESTINKWCGGSSTNIPSLNKVYMISKVLGVWIDYFVNPDVDCLTMDNQMIKAKTGLDDKAIMGLKEINKHDAESFDENEMAKMITKSDDDFHSLKQQRMNIINFIFSHPNILAEYLDAFVKCAVPFDFTVPVIKTNEGNWEKFSTVNNPIALASSENNLNDHMEIDLVGDFHAIAKNKLDMVQEIMLAEYRKTDQNYNKKAKDALIKAYSQPHKKKML